MGCRIINNQTGEVVVNKNSIVDYLKLYEFDSGEETLLELVVGNGSLTLTNKTLESIKEILHPLIIRGVVLPTHFYWRKYIFSQLGNIFSYMGEMENVKKNNEMPDLSQIKWELYNIEKRKEYFENIYKTFGFDTEESNIAKQKTITTNKYASIKIYIYLLYCEQTPYIYYIGRTKNIKTRFQVHKTNHHSSNSKPKYEWVRYIKENGYELKYKVLETGNEYNGSKIEYNYIQQYMNVKKNVVLNFTENYSSTNVIFLHKFKVCLFEKKSVLVNDYNDVSQIKDVKLTDIFIAEPNSIVYALYCDDTPHIYFVGHTRMDIKKRIDVHLTITDFNHHKNEWIKYIKENGYELKYKVLENPSLKKLQLRGYAWINKYVEDPNKVVLNFITTHYNRHNDIFMARFKACLYEKKLILIDDYNDVSELENFGVLESEYDVLN